MVFAGSATQSSINHAKPFCIPFLATRGKGFWFSDDHLEHPYPLMMAQVILVIVISQVLHCFLKPLGQTKFVCNLLAGIILGPSLIGQNKEFRNKLLGEKQNFPLFDVIAKMGVIYFMFLVSVKLDIAMLKRTVKTSWKIFLPSFLFPIAVYIGLLYPLSQTIPGFNGGKILLFLTMCSLSFTYFPVVAEALDELNLLTSELGQIALSTAMLNHAAQWLLTSLHIVVVQQNEIKALGSFLSLSALIIFTIFVVRPLMILIVKNTPEGQDIKEIYVVAIQLGVLVMAFVSDAIGMRHTTGPLIMGLAIPADGRKLGATLIAKTQFLVSEFLLPLFFFRIGTSLDMYNISHQESFSKLQAIIMALYAAKIVGITMAGLLSKISFKSSLVLSLMLNIKGIVELITYSRWESMQLIDEQFFSQIVLSLLVMTMLITPIIRFSYVPHIRAESSANDLLFRLGIQSVMSSKSELFRILCCVHNEESVHNIITLLEASNPTRASPITVYVVHAVQYTGRAAPLLVPYKRREKKFRRSDSNQIMRAFENYSENSRGPVVIHGYTMVAPYKSMHQTIFHLAQDKLVPLIIIPFHENHQSLNVEIGAIRQFNHNVQAYSSCTVGILVDRGLPCRLSMSIFIYKIAVFFIGGPDDREALAYASRMCDNPEASVTVFRITNRSKCQDEEEVREFMLDEAVIMEFKVRNLRNNRLNWHDIEVDNGVQIINAISSSQGHYDLVMVGRRHSDISLRYEEMAAFLQNPELGVLGDMLASSDFCDGTVSVLVLQESTDLGIGAYRCDSTKSSSRYKFNA